MDGRLVVSFRAVGGPGRPFLARLASLLERFRPLGTDHVGLDVLRATLAFDVARFPAVLDRIVASGADTEGQEPPWAVGIAQGEIKPVRAEGSPILASGLLWSGPPLVAATALSDLARPGEILCAQTIPAVRTGELVTSGLRIAREGTLRVRGARVERRQPWKRIARENVARLVEAPFVATGPAEVALEPGKVAVVRADPGAGGTRYLRNLAERYDRSLVLSPVGSGYEPLGALRRAVARALGAELSPLLLELSGPVDALLKGRGVPLEAAARIMTAILWRKHATTKSCLLVDDARSVDPATLEACVRAVDGSVDFGLVIRLDATSGVPSVLAPLPQTSETELSSLSPEAAERIASGVTAGALDDVGRRRWSRLAGGNPLALLEAITSAVAAGELLWQGDAATPRSRAAGRGKVRPASKWIRHRANAESTPTRALLSLLAVAGGEARLDLLARALDRAGIRLDLPATLAFLEATRWIVRTEAPSATSSGAIAFPTRTHCKALFSALEEDARRGLHRSLARVLQEHEGIFGRVEGAWHAAQAGETEGVARVLLDAARATAESGLEASTTQLIALARRTDPSCEAEALELLGNEVARAPSGPPPRASSAPSMPPSGPVSAAPATTPSAPPFLAAAPISVRQQETAATAPPPAVTVRPAEPSPSLLVPPSVDVLAPTEASPRATRQPEGPQTERGPSASPTATAKPTSKPLTGLRAATDRPDVFTAATAPPVKKHPSMFGSSPPDAGAPGSQIAIRVAELAKEALLHGDNASLERWVDGLSAAGESPAFTDRMRAMARLGRGDIGDALRVLRRTRAKLAPDDHRRRCQTSLALGVALSVAGRPQDALLEGLDALARARQFGDERGAKACLAFLAKLYTAVGRQVDGERLRAASI